MADIRDLSRGDVETFIKERSPGGRGQRAFLVALLDLATGTAAPEVGAEALREELGRRSGGTVGAAAFRKQLSRVNDALAESEAPFALVTRGSRVAVVPTEHWDRATQLDSVQRALVSHSGEKMRGDLDSFVPPRAIPDRLLVMWSYAWLPEDQQQTQLELFSHLQRKLAHPPPKYRHLPKIELWRDEERMKPGDLDTAKTDEACTGAFLGLIVYSDRYPFRAACLREADFFLDSKGHPRPDKRYLVLRFNCAVEDMEARFHRRLTFPSGEEAHLLEQWTKGDVADRYALIGKIAEAIFVHAEQWCRHSSAFPAPDDASVSRRLDRVERYMAEQPQRMLHDDAHSTPPLARPGAAGYDAAAVPGASEENGVDIVESLIGWASSKDPERPRVTALLGDFGMGKTVTCQLICRRMLERLGQGDSLPIPVYFDLRDISKPERPEELTLENLIDDLLRRTGETAPTAREVIDFIRSRQALVIFDGLDEVTNKYSMDVARIVYRQLLSVVPTIMWAEDDRQRRAHRAGEQFERTHADGPSLLLSCRSQYFADFAAERGFLSDADRSGLKLHEDIAVFTMLPFSGDQIRDYISRNLPEEDRERALSLIESTYDLSELARRPILLRYIGELVHRLEAEKLAGRTINLTRLYDILVQQAFERDAGKHVIPVSDKKRLLEALALHLHGRQQEEISNERLIHWLDDEIAAHFPRLALALEGEGGLKLSEVFVQDLRNATLLSRPGDTGFRFGHTSLREFFLSAALYRSVLRGSASAQWDLPVPSRETITFLLQRHSIEERPEREMFERNFPTLLSAGMPAGVRWLAFTIWHQSLHTGSALPRPDQIDCSGFALHRIEFRPSVGKVLPFRNSIWRGATLDQSTFEQVDLAGADFSGAEATGSWFISCALGGARFHGATLDGTLWRKCALDGDALEGASTELIQVEDCTIGGQPWRPRAAPPAAAVDWQVHPRSRNGNVVGFDVGTIQGRVTIFVNDGAYARLIDAGTGVTVGLLSGHGAAVSSVAAAMINGVPLVATGADDGEIRLSDADSGICLRSLQGHEWGVHPIALIDCEGKGLLASAGRDGTVRLWSADRGELLETIPYQGVVALSLIRHEQSPYLAIMTAATVYVRLVGGGVLQSIPKAHGLGLAAMLSTIDGRLAVLASEGRIARAWDALSGNEIASYSNNSDMVRSLATGIVDGTELVVGGLFNGEINAWEAKTGSRAATVPGQGDLVRFVKLIENGGAPILLSSGTDREIRVWDLPPRTPRRSFRGVSEPARWVGHARLEGGERVVVSFCGYGDLRVWDAATGRLTRTISVKGRSPSTFALGSEGGTPVVALGYHDGTVQLRDLATGNARRVFTLDQGQIRDVALASFNGQTLLAASVMDGSVRIWDISSGAAVTEIRPDGSQGIAALGFGETQGRPVVATGLDDGSIHLWDAADGTELGTLSGHERRVASIRFERVQDRLLIVSATHHGEIHVTDASTRERILSAMAGGEIVALSVAEGEQGPALCAVTAGGYVDWWDLASGDHSRKPRRMEPAVCGAIDGSDADALLAVGDSRGMIRISNLHQPQETLSILHWEASAIRTRHTDRGEELVSADEDAWRHYVSTYRSGGRMHMAGLHEVPRSSGPPG